jgi:hypothetical protein
MESEQFINLKVRRAETYAWERPSRRGQDFGERIGPWLVSLTGTGLLLYGMYSATRRRTASSVWWMVSGASLLGGAVAGVGTSHWLRRIRSAHVPADVVTMESLDSFPASDAPSSNATTAIPQPLQSVD